MFTNKSTTQELIKNKDIKSLLKISQSNNKDERLQALNAILQVTSELVDMIFNNLPQDNSLTKLSLIENLIKLREINLIDILLPFLSDSDFEVQESAALNLEKLNWIPAKADEKAIFYWILTRNSQKCKELGSLIENPIKELIPRMDHDSLKDFIERLRGFLDKDQAGKILVICMSDPRPVARANAALELMFIRYIEAETTLISILEKETHVETQMMIINTLGSFKSIKSIPLLLNILRKENVDVNVRGWAVEALGKISDPVAIEPLISLYKREDYDRNREKIIESLGEIANPQATDFLIQVLNDSDLDYAGEAASSLGKIGDPKAVDFLIYALDRPHKKSDSKDINDIIRINSSRYSYLKNIYEALAILKDHRAAIPMMKKFDKEKYRPYMAEEIAQALYRLGDKSIAPQLRTILDDPKTHDYVREQATWLLEWTQE